MKNFYTDPADFEVEMQFRPLPFWSWNDELEEAELIRQIHEMHAAGNGGFFMHARGGLKTEYMGSKWMDAVCTCTREAVKLGMQPWLYDENGWPSGFGNGTVNALGREYQSKSAELLPVSEISDNGNVLAWYDKEGSRVPGTADSAYALQLFINPFYVDNLNPKVVKTFISNIYQRYWDELPPDVRENITGIFTDEPQLAIRGIPWSDVLAEEYRKKYGRILLDDFPALVMEIGSWKQIRLDFWQLVTTLFRESYIRQLGKWCKAHGWQLTGHYLMEESFDSQLNMNGAVMPQYDGFTIPGIDHLYRVSSFLTPDIQAVSAAAQNGQKQILVETFGCSGWNFNMKGMKWLYQQHLVYGVNLLCQHLAGYSLHGLRKRDYPASLFYQHSMWQHVRKLHDAFARVGKMLAAGNIECEVLILHGESSAWMKSHGHFQDRFSKDLFQDFCKLSHALAAAGVPFHYGDEIMLAEKGGVSSGRIEVGCMSYSCVIIPPVENILSSTMELLQEFSARGGRIIRLESPAARCFYVNGQTPTGKEQEFWDKLPVCRSNEEMVSSICRKVPALEIVDRNGTSGRIRGTWRHFPEAGERWYYLADFACLEENRLDDNDFYAEIYSNTPEVESESYLEIALPFPAAKAQIIDQETGKTVEDLSLFTRKDGKCAFVKTLPAIGSLLICAKDLPENGKRPDFADVTPDKAAAPKSGKIDLTDGWACRCDDNVMTLEKVTYRLGENSPWQEETDTLSLFNRLLALGQDTPLQIRYAFEILPELDPAKADLKIALEPDEKASYFLNGQRIETEFLPGYFIDRSIRILRLPPEAALPGKNFFEIRTVFCQTPEIRAAIMRAKKFESEANKLYFDSEVEAVYLLGQFGCYGSGKVRKEKANSYFMEAPFALGNMPETVDSGSTVLQGFPFFSGTLILEKDLELSADDAALFSKLNWYSLKANVIQITVNGKEFPVIFAPPYKIDLSGLLHEGKNHIEIRLESSCRNTFGPFHTPETEPRSTSPGSFLTEPDILGKYVAVNVPEYGVLELSPEKIIIS